MSKQSKAKTEDKQNRKLKQLINSELSRRKGDTDGIDLEIEWFNLLNYFLEGYLFFLAFGKLWTNYQEKIEINTDSISLIKSEVRIEKMVKI